MESEVVRSGEEFRLCSHSERKRMQKLSYSGNVESMGDGQEARGTRSLPGLILARLSIQSPTDLA